MHDLGEQPVGAESVSKLDPFMELMYYSHPPQVGRHGAMMAGVQIRPGTNGGLCNPRALMGAEPWRLWSELRGASSLAVAYSPAAGTPGVKEASLCLISHWLRECVIFSLC